MNYYLEELRRSLSSAWVWVFSITGAFGFLSTFNHFYEFAYFFEIASRFNRLSEFIWIRLLNLDIPNLLAEQLTLLSLSLALFVRGFWKKADTALQWVSNLPFSAEDRNARIVNVTFLSLLSLLVFYSIEQIWRLAGIEAEALSIFDISFERIWISLAALLLLSASYFLVFYFPRMLITAILAGAIIVALDDLLDRIETRLPSVPEEWTSAPMTSNDPLQGFGCSSRNLNGEPLPSIFRANTNARMRTGPSLTNPVLLVLQKDQRVDAVCVTDDGRWAGVEIIGVSSPARGFVHVTLLRK